VIIDKCRICGSGSLDEILSLGELGFTGIFPDTPNAPIPQGVLTLVLCNNCTLVQLDRNFPSDLMYGDNYGYRSGLNASMVSHLQGIQEHASAFLSTKPEVVLDIGSNDGTLLRHWGQAPNLKIGMDPTSEKFREYYDESSVALADYFSKSSFLAASEGKKADVITSIAMFYDLEDPVRFATEVAQSLTKNGVWISEQSYMPWMVSTGAYDTICHEHLEYYSLRSLSEIFSRSGLRAISATTNDANGGSIRVVAVRTDSALESDGTAETLISKELSSPLEHVNAFSSFKSFTLSHGERLAEMIRNLNKSGKLVVGLGASTKGSVVLQRAGLTKKDIPAIGDVNPFKFGKYSANSDIPILNEDEVMTLRPDYALILPWHFRNTFEKILNGRSQPIWPFGDT